MRRCAQVLLRLARLQPATACALLPQADARVVGGIVWRRPTSLDQLLQKLYHAQVCSA